MAKSLLGNWEGMMGNLANSSLPTTPTIDLPKATPVTPPMLRAKPEAEPQEQVKPDFSMGNGMPMSDKEVDDEYGEEMPEINQLRSDEGFRNKVYTDTRGFLTVGTGHKLTEEELKKYKEGDEFPTEELEEHFMLDYTTARKGAESLAPKNAPKEVTDILTNMNFQMGKEGVGKFKMMRAALEKGDYKEAAVQMKNSKWYRQTPKRATRLIERMEALSNA